MPLLLQESLAPETQLLVWNIAEDGNWFRSQLQLDDRENALIDAIKNPKRKLHWLSSRLLIRLALDNPDTFIHLENDSSGKPVIHNFPANISISHSENLSALLISQHFEVGVDIEKPDAKIERIKEKFLHHDELATIREPNRLEKLSLYWCVKEAMYKLYGRKQLAFKSNLLVHSFEYNKEGRIDGVIQKEDFILNLDIYYRHLNNHLMAYTISDYRS